MKKAGFVERRILFYQITVNNFIIYIIFYCKTYKNNGKS